MPDVWSRHLILSFHSCWKHGRELSNCGINHQVIDDRAHPREAPHVICSNDLLLVHMHCSTQSDLSQKRINPYWQTTCPGVLCEQHCQVSGEPIVTNQAILDFQQARDTQHLVLHNISTELIGN